MPKPDYPVTAAIRALREKNISFVPHVYDYEEHGGTKHSAEALHVDEHHVIKTLVFETESKFPLIVLMHGDNEVSTKQLARILNVKRVEACSVQAAQKHTGYLFGGTSPFGTRTKLPVYVENTIFDLPEIYINGGKRGFLVEIAPEDLQKALEVKEVTVKIGNYPFRHRRNEISQQADDL
jgi:Cys-tRNA(Pro) deacylase